MGIVYESVILFAVLFFFGYAFSAIVQFKGAPGWGRTGLQVWLYVVLAAYFVYFWSGGRRSLPMKTLEIAVADPSGGPLGRVHALLRYLIASLCLFMPLAAAKGIHASAALLLVVPWLPTLFDARSRSLYDILSGTVLLHRPVPRAAQLPDARTQST